jgi:hypothetical protein
MDQSEHHWQCLALFSLRKPVLLCNSFVAEGGTCCAIASRISMYISIPIVGGLEYYNFIFIFKKCLRDA